MKELLPPSSSATRFRFPPASAPDGAARAGGSGEGDHPHLRRLADRLARLDAAGQHLEDVLRHPGLLEGAGEDQPAGDRRMRIALEQDRVAEREGRRHGAHREDHREVPRRDHADHADGQPLRHAEPALLVGEHLADRPGGQGRRRRAAPSRPRPPRRRPSGGLRRPRGSATTRISSRALSSASAAALRIAARSGPGVAAQPGCASAASFEARRTSSRPALPTEARCSPVAGLCTSSRSLVSRQPPLKILPSRTSSVIRVPVLGPDLRCNLHRSSSVVLSRSGLSGVYLA